MLPIFSSKPIQRIMYYLHQQAGKPVYAMQVAQALEMDRGNTSRYVARLESEELVSIRIQGREKLLELNYQHPLVMDLVSLLDRQYGVETRLRDYVSEQQDIDAACIYGSWASGTAT
ncbi:MAG TPA: helix-turn-helix domain-containing protein, partial [bacterium]|nr:helix-turn-helix domain-containing protein [bacterium]